MLANTASEAAGRGRLTQSYGTVDAAVETHASWARLPSVVPAFQPHTSSKGRVR